MEASRTFYSDIMGAKVSTVQLVSPYSEKGPLNQYLETNPVGGMHHIAIEVTSITGAVDAASKKNVRILSGLPNFGEPNSVFLDPADSNGVLIQLIQQQYEDSSKN
ncbi:methylmalonyl-CoA epimerase, mitochondrial-like [Octopus sinensis]|uniref:Methylmalonyl-CoA epimerase, mitochondrial-like n=1 Tax=Octopus sinensis TaxID=2607531 RepID=A0A6P7TYZ2_9MOLL|nr:methylmalonyl-CoA epimerase, mitochondrial-like [Octopus sinensis]